jgi:acetyl-CoA synthetase
MSPGITGGMKMAGIESVMQENRVFAPSDEVVRKANVSGMAAYQALCKEAERDYTGYWARLAREHVAWKQPFTHVLDDSKAPFYQWFADGRLNVSYNCLDKNIAEGFGDKVAIISKPTMAR